MEIETIFQLAIYLINLQNSRGSIGNAFTSFFVPNHEHFSTKTDTANFKSFYLNNAEIH